MRSPIATLAAFGAWGLAGVARSYQIHSDCGADTALVREIVDQAFLMANQASAAVKTTPIDPNANWLGGQLFQLQGEALKTLIESGFDVGTENGADGVTPGILGIQQEQTGALDALSRNEVVIFCTTDRLSPRPNVKNKMYDSVAEAEINGSDDGCRGIDFMWTYTFRDHWDEIQICPWFLQYARAQKTHTKKDVTSIRAFLAVRGIDKLITKALLTPIDLLSLWDKAMLHELMHTKVGGAKEDFGGWSNAYGWKNAKNLAADGRGINNADNWALFGSALFWFGQGSPIDENGKFTAATTGGEASKAKRWLGSGAGHAWGAMKAEAVRRFT